MSKGKVVYYTPADIQKLIAKDINNRNLGCIDSTEDNTANIKVNLKEINTWDDLYEAFPDMSSGRFCGRSDCCFCDIDDTSLERFYVYTNHRFDLYEKMGFREDYCPSECHSEYDERKGEPFVVLRRATIDDVFHILNLPMWKIKFTDGLTTNAFPWEIIKGVIEPTVETFHQMGDGKRQ
jgi:hypothetical protein